MDLKAAYATMVPALDFRLLDEWVEMTGDEGLEIRAFPQSKMGLLEHE